MADDEFALGADPEALLVIKRTGKIRSPQDIIYDPDPHDEIGKAAGIGKDGDRPTSSFELRPGRSTSGLVLVNRCADLISKLHKHYHPPGIVYRAGAFLEPEPLGGHIHLSWPKTGDLFSRDAANRMWQVCEILKGFRTMTDFLIPSLFKAEEIQQRVAWAVKHGRDFASSVSMRPSSLEQIMGKAHVEYRYPPSWLDSPEAAYCFLGGAEIIVREVMSSSVGKAPNWSEYCRNMFVEGMSPPGSPSLADALRVATEFAGPVDFAPQWVG